MTFSHSGNTSMKSMCSLGIHAMLAAQQEPSWEQLITTVTSQPANPGGSLMVQAAPVPPPWQPIPAEMDWNPCGKGLPAKAIWVKELICDHPKAWLYWAKATGGQRHYLFQLPTHSWEAQAALSLLHTHTHTHTHTSIHRHRETY